jgi:hypothetical protein
MEIDPRELKPYLLTSPNVPKPLHGLAPRTVMGKEWWDKERRLAYKRAAGTCQCCGRKARLDAHESYSYDYAKGRAHLIEIVAICKLCHDFIHSGRLGMRFYDGHIGFRELCAVMYHGFKVLKANGYPPNPFALRVYKAAAEITDLPYPVWHDAALHAVEENPLILPTEMAEWSDWRLVIGEEEYPPLYESYEAWLQHYRGGEK